MSKRGRDSALPEGNEQAEATAAASSCEAATAVDGRSVHQRMGPPSAAAAEVAAPPHDARASAAANPQIAAAAPSVAAPIAMSDEQAPSSAAIVASSRLCCDDAVQSILQFLSLQDLAGTRRVSRQFDQIVRTMPPIQAHVVAEGENRDVLRAILISPVLMRHVESFAWKGGALTAADMKLVRLHALNVRELEGNILLPTALSFSPTLIRVCLHPNKDCTAAQFNTMLDALSALASLQRFDTLMPDSADTDAVDFSRLRPSALREFTLGNAMRLTRAQLHQCGVAFFAAFDVLKISDLRPRQCAILYGAPNLRWKEIAGLVGFPRIGQHAVADCAALTALGGTLEQLIVRGSIDVSFLPRMSKLAKLTLGGLRSESDVHLLLLPPAQRVPAGLLQSFDCPSLTHLTLWFLPFTCNDVAVILSVLPQLQYLRLQVLPKLKSLSFFGSKECTAAQSTLHTLELRLNLGLPDDSEYFHLQALKALTRLHISVLNEQSMTELKSRMPWVEKLE